MTVEMVKGDYVELSMWEEVLCSLFQILLKYFLRMPTLRKDDRIERKGEREGNECLGEHWKFEVIYSLPCRVES